MRPPWRSTGLAAVFVAVAVLVAASCGRSAESWEGSVTISVDLETGQRWTAVGSAVDRGRVCPNGIRHVLEAVDPATGEIVPVRVRYWVVQDAISERNTTAIVLVVEHTCTDGSGSFVTREDWGADVWSVESGTGAYGDLSGGGELSFATTDYRAVTPLRLFVDGTLAGRRNGSGDGRSSGVPSPHVPATTQGSVHARHRRRRSPMGR